MIQNSTTSAVRRKRRIFMVYGSYHLPDAGAPRRVREGKTIFVGETLGEAFLWAFHTPRITSFELASIDVKNAHLIKPTQGTNLVQLDPAICEIWPGINYFGHVLRSGLDAYQIYMAEKFPDLKPAYANRSMDHHVLLRGMQRSANLFPEDRVFDRNRTQTFGPPLPIWDDRLNCFRASPLARYVPMVGPQP